MATQTPSQNSADLEKQNGNKQSGGQDSGGKLPGFWVIPGGFDIGGRRIEITKIEVSGRHILPTAAGGIKLKRNDRVKFTGFGLGIYNRAGFLNEGGSAILNTAFITPESGGTIISFTVPDFNSSIVEGGFFWLKLLSRDVPLAERLISPYLVYQIEETKEEQKKREIAEQEEETLRKIARQGSALEAASLAAAAQSLKSAAGVSTAARGVSGTASSAFKQTGASSALTSNDTDYDADAGQEVSETGQAPAVSTGEISAAGQTISESATVSGSSGARISTSGTAESTGTILQSGTARATGRIRESGTQQSANAEISSTGTVTTKAQTLPQGGTVTSEISGTRQAEVQGTAQTTAGGMASVQSQTQATGRGTISEKTETSAVSGAGGAPRASVSGGGKVAAGAEGTSQTSLNARVSGLASGKGKVDGISGSGTATGGLMFGGSTKLSPPMPSASPRPLPGPIFQGSTNTGGLGIKPPAGLGKIKALDLELTLGKQNTGAKLPTPASAGQTETSGESETDNNLAAVKEPDSSSLAKTGGGDESGRAGAGPEPRQFNPLKPKDDTDVSPPLGQGGIREPSLEGPGSPGQEDSGPGPDAEPSRPIDSPNPPASEEPQVGEPLQMPEIPEPENPEAGAEQSGNEPEAEAADEPGPEGPQPGAGPAAEQAAADALPNAGAGAAEGAEAAGALAEGGAAAGAAAAVPAVAAVLAVESVLSPRTKWWLAFVASFPAAVTFFGFFIAWSKMVVCWVEGNKAGPEKSLGQAQKIATVIHFFTPFLIWAVFIFIILVTGCNFPVPKSKLIPTYRGTVIGLIIGDKCQPFDMANFMPSGGSGPPNSAAANPPPPAPPAAGNNPLVPVLPRGGGSPAPVPATASILSYIKPWNPANDPYPAVDWGNSDANIDPDIKSKLAELQTAFNALNQSWQSQGRSAIVPRQVYRPQTYQEHYRSVWEINAIINNQDNTVGYQCDQISHLDPAAVKQAYSQASSSDKQTLQQEFNKHTVTGPTPAGCVSDHISGIAMDINPPIGQAYTQLLAESQKFGLCHNIPGDLPHFALLKYLPAGTACNTP